MQYVWKKCFFNILLLFVFFSKPLDMPLNHKKMNLLCYEVESNYFNHVTQIHLKSMTECIDHI